MDRLPNFFFWGLESFFVASFRIQTGQGVFLEKLVGSRFGPIRPWVGPLILSIGTGKLFSGVLSGPEVAKKEVYKNLLEIAMDAPGHEWGR